MATVPPIPPTYADPVLVDPVTKKGGFNPIWLNWFLQLATWLSSVATSLSDGDKGDVVVSAGGTVWVVDANAVSYAKMQDVSAASRVLGRGSAAGAGDPEELIPTGGLEVNGTNLRIADNGVTYAKMQDVTAAERLVGRGAGGGAGDPQEISLGSGLSMAGTALDVSSSISAGVGFRHSFLLMGG